MQKEVCLIFSIKLLSLQALKLSRKNIFSTFRYLRELTSGLAVGTGLPHSTVLYLEKRIQALSQRERMVSIIIDEVYCARQVEYSNGRFFGHENGEPTKTLLCFMLKGVASKYSDIVAMIPLTSISSAIIKTWWDNVVKTATTIGFDIVATIVDGHSANRRFYVEELCKGKLQPFVTNPHDDHGRIYLLFDSVHIFKNLYNNLLNKKEFKCPPFGGEELSAAVQHVHDLFKSELGRSVRYAHKLTDKVLNPKPIEKTNVDLAWRFFHESTIQGLEYFSRLNGKSEWMATARLFKLFLRFFNTVNVKNPRSGFMKRDESRRPISKNYRQPAEFLEEFSNWLALWEKMPRKNSLTMETFLAIKQSATALPALADYLISAKGLSFVLLGLINSGKLLTNFLQIVISQ